MPQFRATALARFRIDRTVSMVDHVIVGAGIIGICSALALRRAGLDVLLLDRGAPGAETSHGNTGVLVESPWRIPGGRELLRRLPRILLGRDRAVRIAPGHWPAAAALLVRMMRDPDHDATRAVALHRLLRTSLTLHRTWIAEAEATNILRETGWLKLFRTSKVAAGFALDLELLRRSGTVHRFLDAGDLRALEPALAPGCAGGLLLENACSLSNPRTLSERYMAHFLRLGGRFAQTAVTGIAPDGAGWRILHSDGCVAAGSVVVAAGPWSAYLLAPLGFRLPMFFERGYHLHLSPGPGPSLRRPVHDIAGGYVMTPQSAGVRVTSGVEIAARDAPPQEAQIRRAVQAARALAALGPPVEDRAWMGSRPSLPDGLPAIGPLPGRPGIWLNVGHHHVGLSLAAGSGDLLARRMAGTAAADEASPFEPGRLWPDAPRPASAEETTDVRPL